MLSQQILNALTPSAAMRKESVAKALRKLTSPRMSKVVHHMEQNAARVDREP